MAKSENAILVKNLQKSFKEVKVLQGINFEVKKGTVLALLGPNGAGKTTTIRILSTLLLPDGGQAKIVGHDVVKNPDEVRSKIGLTGQFAAVDEYLTGEENLQMIGRLYHLSLAEASERTEQLLQQFDLVEPGKRKVKTYSGGMRRRLDLAMSLIGEPKIIFLDEPTTGLDPRSRLAMWEMIKELVKAGTTILLTTQDMDEADNLADRIIVIDNGKVIAEGTADSLKKRVGSDRLELVISKKSNFETAQGVLSSTGMQVNKERRALDIATKGGVKDLKDALARLEKAKIDVESVSLHRPTLDDVFLTLTGHVATVVVDGELKKEKNG
jgi:ABC-2 type transport system ATP-binding protein